ncbi:MAG: hypothetical protein FJ308_20785 [Planctomycetes bacterium]|nr:hypothetical protein [Planctomycetota bacterium]
MKLLDSLKNLRSPRSLTKSSGGRVAFMHWDRESVHYFVLTPGSKRIQSKDFGAIEYTAPDTPFVALANHFSTEGIHATRMVVLLSRPELDLISLTLPPSERSEIAALVAAEVEQQLGETPEPPVIDYYVTNGPKDGNKGAVVKDSSPQEAESVGVQVLAFALSQKERDSIQTQCTEAGFKLQGIGSRALGPLSLLRQQNLPDDTLDVLIHLYPGETELTICRGVEPLLLRSIRNSTDDADRVAEQIWLETQRCLTLLPQPVAELPKSWFLFATGEFATAVTASLEAHEEINVTPLDPFAAWEVQRDESDTSASTRITSAANSGAALDFVGQRLPVNLLDPKRPPVPQSLLRRWGGWGVLAASAASIGGYLLLSDVWQLQSEADGLQTELRDATKLTSKYLEKSDQVQAVEGWLSDQVDWLTELTELSTRLPEGSNASVRRLTASSGSNGASIDISVQANTQETISELENRIRGAKYSAVSKQISQNANSAEYPWQFDTHITFELDPPRPKLFGPSTSSPSDRKSVTLKKTEEPVTKSTDSKSTDSKSTDSKLTDSKSTDATANDSDGNPKSSEGFVPSEAGNAEAPQVVDAPSSTEDQQPSASTEEPASTDSGSKEVDR